MAKTKDFDDPLADIDPIMEEAFSVSDEEKAEVKPKKKRGRPKKKATKDVVVESQPEESIEEDQEDDEPFNAEIVIEPPSVEVDFPDLESSDQEEDLYGADLDEIPKAPDPIVSDVRFPDIDNEKSDDKLNSGIFSNIPVDVSVELGRSQISLKEIFELTEGSIIELERLVGEPLDLVVNSQVVAQGEVVAIDNNYGLRVTNIVSAVTQ